MSPDVTVVICSHRPELLPRAMASVRAQTVRCALVVQDSPEWWGDKWNDAIRASHTPWIIPLCDDDALHPTFVERTLDVVGGAGMVLTDRTVVNPTDPILATWFRVEHHTEPCHPLTPFGLTRGCPAAMTALIGRDVFEDCGGYDPDLMYQDWGFYCEAYTRGHSATLLHEPLWTYHEHAESGANTIDHNAALAALQTKYPMLPWVRRKAA